MLFAIVMTVAVFDNLLKMIVNQVFTPHNSNNLNISTICYPVLSRVCTDIYRGWAIIIIMVGHVSVCWNWVGFGPFGGTGVAIFLLLSGYGLHESFKKNGLKGFWQKKLMRIALPYILFRVIWMMVEGNLSLNYWWGIVNCSNSVFWYIDYIVRCYIVFYIACKLTRWHLKWGVLGAFSIYSFFGLSTLCATQAFSFISGVILSANAVEMRKIRNWQVLMTLAVAGVMGLGALAVKHLYGGDEGLSRDLPLLVQNLSMAVAFITFLYFTRRWVSGLLVSLFGALSLELYIIHMRLLPMVGESLWQGVALIIAAALFAYSFNRLCKWIINLMLNYQVNE